MFCCVVSVLWPGGPCKELPLLLRHVSFNCAVWVKSKHSKKPLTIIKMYNFVVLLELSRFDASYYFNALLQILRKSGNSHDSRFWVVHG